VKLPSAHAEPERYRGRPLLAILEAYVLDCIGALEPEKLASVALIVQRVFGGGSDWRATIRSHLHLADGVDESIRSMWVRNQDIAVREKVALHPVQFAKMFVDQNWADLVTPIE
jgi:hypothetical protein